MEASFQRRSWELTQAPAPWHPGPDEARTRARVAAGRTGEPPRTWATTRVPIDIVRSEPGWLRPGEVGRPQPTGVDAHRGKLPEDPLLHACALTFAAGHLAARRILGGHGEGCGGGWQVGASLRPRVWLQRPFRGRTSGSCKNAEPVGIRRRGWQRTVCHHSGRNIDTAVQEVCSGGLVAEATAGGPLLAACASMPEWNALRASSNWLPSVAPPTGR